VIETEKSLPRLAARGSVIASVPPSTSNFAFLSPTVQAVTSSSAQSRWSTRRPSRKGRTV
jgi:hypothetical protein